jgi:hypothetical protein
MDGENAAGAATAGEPSIAFMKQIDPGACEDALADFAFANTWYLLAWWALEWAMAAPPVAPYLYADLIAAGAYVTYTALKVNASCPA